MESGYVNLFRGLLVNPQSTLKSLKRASLQSAFFYFIFVWSVFATLFCLVGWLQNPSRNTNDTFFLAAFVVIVFIGWLYFGLVIHTILRLLNGPKSILITYKAILYAATPLAVIGWIPLIGGLSFIWALILFRQAIIEFHDISSGTAISVIFQSLIIGILTFGIAYFFLPVVISILVY